MATHKIDFTKILLPDSSGNVGPGNSASYDTNDRYPHEVLVFKDTATKLSASASFTIPNNYVSAPTIASRWRTAVASGDVRWNVELTPIRGDNTTSGDPAADTEALAVTDSAGTALRLMATSIAGTAGNYQADDLLLVKVSRDGTNVADTLVGDVFIEAVQFTYADA
jgi:hypothetical protein